MEPDREKNGWDRMQALYANYLAVGFNAFEFILDFGQAFEEPAEPRTHTRIMTNPEHARAFSDTLRESLAEYDSEFGRGGHKTND